MRGPRIPIPRRDISVRYSLGQSTQHSYRIDILTSMDAHRIPLCVPTCPPSPAFAVGRHSILWNCRFSSRSCFWFDVRLATPYSLWNPIGCYECENEGRSTEVRRRSGSDEKHRRLTNSGTSCVSGMARPGHLGGELKWRNLVRASVRRSRCFCVDGLMGSNAGKRPKKTRRVIR